MVSFADSIPIKETVADLAKRHAGTNPATGEKLWAVPIANQQDVDDAVIAAQRAQEKWQDVPIEKRKELIGKFKDHYLAHADEMTELLCQETGKPVGLLRPS